MKYGSHIGLLGTFPAHGKLGCAWDKICGLVDPRFAQGGLRSYTRIWSQSL